MTRRMSAFRIGVVAVLVGAALACGSSTGGTGGGSGGSGGGGGGTGGSGGSGGGTADAGLCPTTYANGCATVTDLTDGGSTATFDWPTVFNAPACIKVKTFQTISFTGVGTFHPLIQDCGPRHPINGEQDAPFTATFQVSGLYGVHCPNHGLPDGTGMGLAIEVQ
jgi:plastocyanin